MQLAVARLEEWMREAYFAAEIDIGSSGVESYVFRELRELIGLELTELDGLMFSDSHTLGGTRLREIIAERLAGNDASHVMVTHGSSEANYLLHLALLRPGDEVIVLSPAYEQLKSLGTAMGAKARLWPLRPENRFVPDVDDLRRLLDRNVRMVVLNFPHNPTGASLDLSSYNDAMEAIANSGAWLLWDAAFADLVYHGRPLPDPTTRYERAISMGTLSKAFGLPGLRVGWCLAPSNVLDECVRLRDYISLHLSPLIEAIAEKVFLHADEILAHSRAKAVENLDICRKWAAELASEVEWYEPAGGVCAFPRLHVADVDALCRQLIQHDRVLTVPGSCFGCPSHIRLGFGGSSQMLEKGLSALARRLKSV